MIKQAGVYFSAKNTSLKHWQKNCWKAVKKKSHFIFVLHFKTNG